MTESENQEAKALERVKDILWEMHGDRREQITLETELYLDLGVDGDDAVEVFEKIEEIFHVDFSCMQWDRHFGPEAGLNPFVLLARSWWKWQRERVPVTVQDLVDAICAKRWIKHYSADGISQPPKHKRIRYCW